MNSEVRSETSVNPDMKAGDHVEFRSDQQTAKSPLPAQAGESDTSELYYAHMETDRAEAEEAYFKARPQVDGLMNRQLFRAGFERAYAKLWPAVIRGGIK